METINGITFEDFALAAANLAAGMPEQEMCAVLGIELPVWVETCDLWSAKLGDMMAQDMSVATKYAAYFQNPKQGKFADASTQTAFLDDLLKIVPDFDTYQKIFWHMSKGAEVGVDGINILEEYGLTLQGWSSISMYHNEYFHSTMDETNFTPEELQYNFNYTRKVREKWENHWDAFYKSNQADLADDIDF